MHNLLTDILKKKEEEIALLKRSAEINPARHNHRKKPAGLFKNALKQNGVTIIGEIKRASPSKGKLANIPSVTDLAALYETAGVDAFSVLTEKNYFAGSTEDLIEVLAYTKRPVLRKDFILDTIQIDESLALGADAILLIVAVLEEKTALLFEYAKEKNLDVIVEVHNKTELQLAIDIGAEIIGINNRNLFTFEEDLNTAFALRPLIPEHIISIAESGIRSPENMQLIAAARFDAVLIGESLVRSADPVQFIKRLREATKCNF